MITLILNKEKELKINLTKLHANRWCCYNGSYGNDDDIYIYDFVRTPGSIMNSLSLPTQLRVYALF